MGRDLDLEGAWTLLNNGDAPAALVQFEEMSRLAPRHIGVKRGLAACYLAVRRLRDAQATLEAALLIAGTDARLLELHAQVLRMQATVASNAGDLDREASLIHRALTSQPTLIGFQRLWTIQLALGQRQEAEQTMQQTLAAFPFERNTYLSLFRAHQMLGKPEEETLELLAAAKDLFPTDLEVLGLHGRQLFRMGRYPDAHVDLQFVAKSRQNASNLAYAALCALSVDKDTAAQDAMHRLLQMCPNDIKNLRPSLKSIVAALEARGHVELAEQCRHRFPNQFRDGGPLPSTTPVEVRAWFADDELAAEELPTPRGEKLTEGDSELGQYLAWDYEC